MDCVATRVHSAPYLGLSSQVQGKDLLVRGDDKVVFVDDCGETSLFEIRFVDIGVELNG
jgi:hypothetical protein